MSKENLPDVLGDSKSKKAFNLLEKNDNSKVLEFKNKISEIEVEKEEVEEFLGKENMDLFASGKKTVALSKMFELDKKELLNTGIVFFENDPSLSEEGLAKMLLEVIATKEGWLGEIAREMIKEGWGENNA